MRLAAAVAVAAAGLVAAADCVVKTSSGAAANLTALFPQSTFNVTLAVVAHPPSSDTVSLVGSPCGSLKVDTSIPADDQCPDKTQLCEVVTNWKRTDGRVVSVRPVVDSSHAAEQVISQSADGLRLAFEGANKTTVTLIVACNKDVVEPSQPKVTVSPSDPRFYLPPQQITIEWTHAAGCVSAGVAPGQSGSSMSALGFFFTMLFGGLAAYFIVGMAYNYTSECQDVTHTSL
nr:hypothetical protein HK105_002998 [Polyrhizophydium stewartii]